MSHTYTAKASFHAVAAAMVLISISSLADCGKPITLAVAS